MTVDAGILPPIDFTPEPVDDFFAIVGNTGFWQRAGVIAAGSFLLVVGTVILISGTKAVKDVAGLVTGVASKVVTKGAV